MKLLEIINQYDEWNEKEINYLREEVKYWRDKYNESLYQSIKHNDAMFGLILTETLKNSK